MIGSYKKEVKINDLDNEFYKSVLGKSTLIQLDTTEEMESGMSQMLDSILNIVGESYSKILRVYDFYEASEMAVNEMPRVGFRYFMHAYACLCFLTLKH